MKKLNRVQAMNTLYEFVNQITPLIQTRLSAGFGIKQGKREFYQKDQLDLRDIISQFERKGLTAFIEIQSCTIYLKAKQIYFIEGREGNDYVHDSIYLFCLTADSAPDFEPRNTYTEKEYNAQVSAIKVYEKDIATLQSKISNIRYELSL